MTSTTVVSNRGDIEVLTGMSDRELLQHWGFQPHQIIDLPDGGAILNAEILELDALLNRIHLMDQHQPI